MNERSHVTTESPTGQTRQDTFPRLLADHARTNPNGVALQEKRYGIWQPITWQELNKRVHRAAYGLDALGVGAGDIVGVLGDNRPEWLITELAAQAIGAAVVGIYPNSVGEEITHILSTARAKVVVAEDQEQVDKLIGLRHRIADLESIVFYDPRGMERYSEAGLLQFSELEARGAAAQQERPGFVAQRIAAATAEDVAVICTTSGTTAHPKLAMLSHRNLLSMASRLMELDPLVPRSRYVSFLPFAWIGEQMIAVAAGLLVGFTISFPEAAATVRNDLREIGPDVMFSPPAIWESMVSDLQVRLAEAGWLKRKTFSWGYNVGERVVDHRERGAHTSLWLRFAHSIADVVAGRPVRNQFGLSRLHRSYTGGAPLGPDVFRFFHAIGVNLKQIYGQTEICGLAVVHPDGDVKFDTVGRPIPGTELRIDDGGEILLRSAAVFSGYLHDPEATQAAIDGSGWLHTGDAGYLDEDGQLVVIDRARDVVRASDGTLFSPAFIENKLKFSPYIEEAVTFWSTGTEVITAIVAIDAQTVGAWAEQRHLSYTTYTDLTQKAPVRELVASEVYRANQDLNPTIQVQRFLILHKHFDADDEEVTRTRKIRRSVIHERYRHIIAALDSLDDSVTTTSSVMYQDGSTVERTLDLPIQTMVGFTPRQVRRGILAWSAA